MRAGRGETAATRSSMNIAGQARGDRSGALWRSTLHGLGLLALAAALAACGGHVEEGKDCPQAVWSKTVSGFCVPRWVSLKRGVVYGRKGPGTDYPAVWVYRAPGLPVQVVGETTDWRRICDPDGGATWVHRSMVDGRRRVMAVPGAPTPLYRKPGSEGGEAGLLNARSLANLRRCKDGSCQVTAGGVTGWLDSKRVWGLTASAQCR